MADRRGVLLPLIFLSWIYFNSQVSTPRARYNLERTIEDVVADERRQLWAVGNSSWEAEFRREGQTVNITGLEAERGYAWDALPAVRGRAQEQLEYALGDWGKAALEGEAEGRNPIPLYSNVTGYVLGKWKRSSLQENVAIPRLNLTEYTPRDPFGQRSFARSFERNVTGGTGEATIRLNQYEGAYMENSTTEMGIELVMTDEDYDEWQIQLYGTYDTKSGSGVFATTSDKFGGIFALPHFALSRHNFETARNILNNSISAEIDRQITGKSYQLNPWTSKVEEGTDFVYPRCEMILYLQQMATATNMEYGSTVLRLLEHELRSPTGAAVPAAPDLHFSMLAFSPDCGYVLESQGPPDEFAQDGDHLVGPKLEMRYKETRHHLLAYTFVLLAQLFLLMRQMREASTPSTRSRISFYTAVILVLGDGYITMSLIVLSSEIAGLVIQFAGAGFIAFINVALFGMSFVRSIWLVQEPERERALRAEVEEELQREQRLLDTLNRIRAERRAREEAATTTTADDSVNGTAIPSADSNTPTLATQEPSPPTQPVPGTFPQPAPTSVAPADTGATPVFFMPSDQEDLAPVHPFFTPTPRNPDAIVASRMPTFGSIYVRTYATLVAIIFLSLFAGSWPAPVRRVFYTFLAICSASFWIPQIARNVQRNCRHALQWEFVIGQSILRLVPFAYFYVYKDNVVFAEQDYYSMTLLVIWVWLQIVLLGSQELIGPRWFVKSDWAPDAYDYHPVLREDEEGGNMPIGFSEAAAVANDAASIPSSPVDERTPSLARRASMAKETKEKGKRIFDCAICMQDLEVPVVEAGAPRDGGSLGANLLARRNYMVTPCRHIFHSACLEGWMKFRLQCPICRETLPSL